VRKNGKEVSCHNPGLNPKHEIPAFAPQGGASRRQAKFDTKRLNPKLETLNSKQTQMVKAQNPNLSFIFWICLGLRV